MRELSLQDLYWAEEQLNRFTYKPGWKMRLVDPLGPYDDPGIYISFTTENTYQPGRPILIESRQRLPSPWIIRRDEDKFAAYLLDALFKVERHEAQEWLKRDGVMIFDPHKENSK